MLIVGIPNTPTRLKIFGVTITLPAVETVGALRARFVLSVVAVKVLFLTGTTVTLFNVETILKGVAVKVLFLTVETTGL